MQALINDALAVLAACLAIAAFAGALLFFPPSRRRHRHRRRRSRRPRIDLFAAQPAEPVPTVERDA